MVPDNTNNVDRILENDYRNIAGSNPKIGAGYSDSGKAANVNDVNKINLSIAKKDEDINPGTIQTGNFLFGETSNVFGKFFKHQKFKLIRHSHS